MNAKLLSIKVDGLGKVYDPIISLRKATDIFKSANALIKNKRTAALEDVSFSIYEGERVGIIGQNGAGKSTLLKLIAGTANPTSGSLDINGNVHAVLTLGVGLREELTGRDNFYLDAEVHGKQRADVETIIDEMVAFADLGEFIDKPVNTYSSGMKARLTFTSLVFIEPEILLLDETLSTGDQWFQKKATKAMHQLCAKGKIVIIVSHGMDAIREMCDRCIWLKDGKLFADGDPMEVTSAYEDDQRRRVDNELEASFAIEDYNWSESEDYQINCIKLFSSGQENAGHVLLTGKQAMIEIGLSLRENLQAPNIRLKIMRVDGLVVLNTAMPDDLLFGQDSLNPVIKAHLGDLLIGPGLFKCEVELSEHGAPRAIRSVVFKVHSDQTFRGGRPVLYYPIDIKAVS